VIDYYRKKGSLVDINAERNAKMVTRDIRAVLN
jgi:adenylate kinase family enzyme